MKTYILSVSLCLTFLACAPGQIFEPVALDDAALAHERQSLVDRLAHPVDPAIPTSSSDFPRKPTVDPRMDPPEFASDPRPSLPTPKPSVDPTMDPPEPDPVPGSSPIPPTGDDGFTDPVSPEPEPEAPEQPDLGMDPYAEKTCKVETRCRTVASGQECTDYPQQCPPTASLCSTTVKRCRTLYVELCSDIEVCDETK